MKTHKVKLTKFQGLYTQEMNKNMKKTLERENVNKHVKEGNGKKQK